jgi:DNA-binding NarL/FixJ family response regulator
MAPNSGSRSEVKFIADARPLISMLLVEDEEAILKLLTTIIARKYTDAVIFSAINGKAGLELFERHTPDIVITDINMPEMNGLEMGDKIRAIKPDTKFIILTGDSRKRDSVEKSFAFDHYIEKPVIFGVLFAAIDQTLGEFSS